MTIRGLLIAVAVLWLVVVVLTFIARHRWVQQQREERERIEDLIGAPIYRDEWRKADESLPAKAALRRAVATEKRIEAAQIESGAPTTRPSDRLKLIGRR